MPRGGNLQHPRVVEGRLCRIKLRVLPAHRESRTADAVVVGCRSVIDAVAHRGKPAVGTRHSLTGPGNVKHLLMAATLVIQPALDDLHPVQVRAIGLLLRDHQELRQRVQFSALENSLGVITTGEKAQADARSAGGIDFAPLQGSENGLTGILLGPDCRQP